jgi:transmembrane protein TMEM260 (protein O-mannosyltransferase)
MAILAKRNATTWVGTAIVVGAAAFLYFVTAARDIVVGDTPELITAAATLGVAHEPGYPLFTMLGHFFSLIPFGSIPFRVNLLSATCDALTVGVIYLAAIRLTRSYRAAAIAALILAVNPIFWTWSLAAEVFPLNNLLAAILILLLVTWHEEPERSGALVTAFFVAGLALTNHQTIVLLAPAFGFVLWQRRSVLRAHPGFLASGVIAFAIGLLPYAYVPWASAHHPAYNWGNVSSIRDLIAVIRRKTYGTGHLVSVPEYRGGSAVARVAALLSSLGLTSLALTLLGALAAYRRARWYFWFSVIAFIFAGPFFVWITNLDLATAPSALFILQRFFLLSQVILAPLVAFGVLWIARLIRRHAPQLAVSPSRLVAGGSLIAVTLIVLTNYRHIDQSRNFIERRFVEDVWATTEPGSILLARGDIAFALMYFQKVEHTGKGTQIVLIPLLSTDWYVHQLREEHSDLIVPFDRYDVINNNLKKFVEANNDRRICIAGTLGNDDHSLDDVYWPYQRGLLLIVEPRSKAIPLQQMIEENKRLLDHYRPPAPNAIRADTFESDILTMYAWPAFRIGTDCARVGLKEEARTWYQRALGINPRLSQARDALTRLEH